MLAGYAWQRLVGVCVQANAVRRSSQVWGSRKSASKKPGKTAIGAVMGDNAELVLGPLRARVKEQGDLVRDLKASGAGDLEVKMAVAELKSRKKVLEDRELSLAPESAFDRAKLEDLLKRRFFYDQSFAIYGGVSGLYDFGPMGCALKANILALWRRFFVLEEQMLEVDCSILTPEPVLKASGHVERFTDLMVKDVQTGECFRLDHLIKAHLEKLVKDKKTSAEDRVAHERTLARLDGMSETEMGALIGSLGLESPSGHKLSEPATFNLMFGASIGPTGLLQGFLRPETAQGIFVNFKRLLEFNAGRLPFAAAQIGVAFRNEISPRSGLLRVREFTMAEIEHFCDPQDKRHPKFDEVRETVMTLYSAEAQMSGQSASSRTIGPAVDEGLVDNETLGYFLARIQAFLIRVGVDPGRLRFRQHMSSEMAHYATDCWDAEILTSYGWVECVGCADRSCYDLTQHSKATRVRLSAEKKLPQPKQVTVREVVANKAAVGKAFKKQAKEILEALANLEPADVDLLEKQLAANGEFRLPLSEDSVLVTPAMASVVQSERTVHVEELVPSVIEPSFGVGRVMYSLLEHAFRAREGDEQRNYLSLPALVSPLKCVVLPLSSNAEFTPLVKQISASLRALEVSHKVDDSSGSIGRRYARADEVAIPFGVTVDFDSLAAPQSATLRERDSTRQVRVPVSELPSLVRDLSLALTTWPQVELQFPVFEQQQESK